MAAIQSCECLRSLFKDLLESDGERQNEVVFNSPVLAVGGLRKLDNEVTGSVIHFLMAFALVREHRLFGEARLHFQLDNFRLRLGGLSISLHNVSLVSCGFQAAVVELSEGAFQSHLDVLGLLPCWATEAEVAITKHASEGVAPSDSALFLPGVSTVEELVEESERIFSHEVAPTNLLCKIRVLNLLPHGVVTPYLRAYSP